MEEHSVPSPAICPYRLPRVGYWQLPVASVCAPIFNNKSDFPPDLSRALFLEHSSCHAQSVAVYTDGSKTDTGVGFGVVFPSFTRSAALSPVSSVFTAELSAIIFTLQTIFTLPVNSFTIFTDSRSVLCALSSFVLSTNPLLLSAVEWLFLLRQRGYNIGFCWVPGHVGVHGNEQADQLARDAVLRDPRQSPVPCRDIFPVIRARLLSSWQARWDVFSATSKLGQLTRSVSPPWSYTHIHDRRHQTALTRLRIGHTLLTHGHLMSRDPEPFCPDCLVSFTVLHLLVECPSLAPLRHRHLYNCRGPDGTYLLSLVLGPGCPAPGFDVLGFLGEAGHLPNL